MRTTLLLFSFLLALALVHSSGLDYWKAIKSDPLNWVDRELPREVLGEDQNVYLPRFNKQDPHFRIFNNQWRQENFNIKSRNLGRPWQDQDGPELFFKGQSYVSDLTKLPLSGQASSEPWSSTYWPIEYGILSVRYANNEKNTFVDDQGNSLTWKQSIAKYSEPADFQAAQQAGNLADYVNNYFSPAEKYDLLLGDTQAFTLTNNNKQQGAQYEDSNGDVESWMGICHGWAPAAISTARPQNDVTLTAADGKTQIKFYADDIRGLTSLKYAATQEEELFAGGRCNTADKDIAKDPASGLITDYTCFDINPGSWVIILANRMGLQKKSFVIDATFDLQVWNQPMFSYSMSYFNILTDAAGDLEASKVKPADIANSDQAVMKFIHKMTSSKATHLVGVNMDIVYIAETSPSHNAPGADRKVKVNYVFTLELDDQNNIVGGEWLHNQHPDFIWAPADGARPLNDEDNTIASSVQGDISNPAVLQQLTQYAQSASARGEVLGKVIDYLVAKSAGGASLREANVESEYRRLRAAYVRARNEYSDFLARN